MKRFSDLCMGRYMCPGLLKSFLSYGSSSLGPILLYCSHTYYLFTTRDGKYGRWPPLTSPQVFSAYQRGSSWWLPNNWLCCTWAQKFAFGKALFTGRAKNSSFHIKVKVKFCSVMFYFVNPWDVVHGILQARILEWVACPFSRGSSQPRDRTKVSRTAGRFFTSWATREAQVKIN